MGACVLEIVLETIVALLFDHLRRGSSDVGVDNVVESQGGFTETKQDIVKVFIVVAYVSPVQVQQRIDLSGWVRDQLNSGIRVFVLRVDQGFVN